VKIKSLILFFLMLALLLSSCENKEKAVTDNGFTDKTKKSGYQIEEYYEKSEFNKYDYDWINDIKCSDNNVYLTGVKEKITGNRFFIYSGKDKQPNYTELLFDYSSIQDACILGNNLYILHDNAVSVVDKNRGNLIVEKKIDEEVSVIQTDGQNFYLEQFGEEKLYIYNKDLNFVETRDLSKLTGMSEGTDDYRFLCTDDRIYVAGDVDGLISLYLFDKDFSLLFKQDYPDLSDMAYEIYDDGLNIILVSNSENYDELTFEYTLNSYVNVLDYNGNVENRMEILNSNFVFWDKKENQMISKYSDDVKLVDAVTGSESNLMLPDDFVAGRVSQSGDEIVFFEETESELKAYAGLISPDGEYSEFPLSSDKCKISAEGNLYHSVTNEETCSVSVFIKNLKTCEERNIYLENSEKDFIYDIPEIVCCNERIYSVWYDLENILQVSVYDSEGRSINRYNFPYNKNLLLAGMNFAYITCNDKSILKLGDNGIETVDYFKDTEVSSFYDGDERYDLYYAIGSVVYGYNEKSGSGEKILNCIDSGISCIGNVFTSYTEDKFITDTFLDDKFDVCMLTKANQETVNLLNSRKVITLAGDTVNWSKSITDSIVEFNNSNKEYYIACRDYSVTDEYGISGFRDDVLKGKIPDIFISGGILDMKLMENMKCLENLHDRIAGSDIMFEDFYKSCLNQNENFFISPCIRVGFIENYSGISALAGKVSTEEFLDIAEKNELKFSETDRYQLFDYFISSRYNDYIDYENKSCSFNSDKIIRMLEYIKNAYDADGQLYINANARLYDMSGYDSDNPCFEISDNAEYSASINESPRIAVYSGSEYKDAAWEFIEMVMKSRDGYDDYGIPVVKSDKEITEYDYYNIDKKHVSEIISKGRNNAVPDFVVQGILYQKLGEFFEGKISARDYAEDIQKKLILYVNEI